MRTEEYLRSKYSEPMPVWLSSFTPGSAFDRSAFFSSRLVFYPGSGNDGHAVQVFASSHSAHCFVYADYLYPEVLIKNELGSCGFRGYSTLGRIELSQFQVSPNGWTPHVTSTEFEQAKNAVSPTGIANKPERFGFLEILERFPNLDDTHGAQRIALLFLGADGHATYDALFCQSDSHAPFAILLQDHGFGGNFSDFGQGGLMCNIAMRTNCLPELLLVAENTHAWEGYTPIRDLDPTYGGMHQSSRRLFALP